MKGINPGSDHFFPSLSLSLINPRSIPMTEIDNQTEAEAEVEVDPIEVIYEGECPSLSGRSTLSYTIGCAPSMRLR